MTMDDYFLQCTGLATYREIRHPPKSSPLSLRLEAPQLVLTVPNEVRSQIPCLTINTDGATIALLLGKNFQQPLWLLLRFPPRMALALLVCFCNCLGSLRLLASLIDHLHFYSSLPKTRYSYPLDRWQSCFVFLLEQRFVVQTARIT
jgi:hypothetical protein